MSRDVRRRIMASRAQEARGMDRLGGQRHAGSGNGNRKADGRRNGESWRDPDHLLVEFKRTDKQQITVKAKDIEQLVAQALVTGRRPVFGIEIAGKNYAILPESDYRELLGLDEEDEA